jgi:hypothetical protein
MIWANDRNIAHWLDSFGKLFSLFKVGVEEVAAHVVSLAVEKAAAELRGCSLVKFFEDGVLTEIPRQRVTGKEMLVLVFRRVKESKRRLRGEADGFLCMCTVCFVSFGVFVCHYGVTDCLVESQKIWCHFCWQPTPQTRVSPTKLCVPIPLVIQSSS